MCNENPKMNPRGGLILFLKLSWICLKRSRNCIWGVYVRRPYIPFNCWRFFTLWKPPVFLLFELIAFVGTLSSCDLTMKAGSGEGNYCEEYFFQWGRDNGDTINKDKLSSSSRHTLCNEDLCYWLRWMRAALWEQMSKRQVDVCLGLMVGILEWGCPCWLGKAH